MAGRKKLDQIGHDGLLKFLTWNSPILTSLMHIPPVVGDPIQQEFPEPVERIVDRLYRLEDGSLLHVENQTSLNDRIDLARRMIGYRLRIMREIPDVGLKQVVIYTGSKPKKRSDIPDYLTYEDIDEKKVGIRFRVKLIDWLTVPLENFRRSGTINDLLLGILGSGRFDKVYQAEVVVAVRQLRGEPRRDAMVKLTVVFATVGLTLLDFVGDIEMWMQEIKDEPLAKEFVEIAGRDRLAAERKRAIAESIVSVARSMHHEVDESVVDELVIYGEELDLQTLIGKIVTLEGDFREFVIDNGIDIPRLTP